MLTADPLTNLSGRGQATHRETREAVVQALLGSGDTWTHQEVAKSLWNRGSVALGRLRQQALQAAHAAAEGHRRDLFDMTRAAAHVPGDTLARDTAREAAKRAARKVKSETEAQSVIAAAVRKPNAGGGFPLVTAGAVAERAHDEGWDQALMAWATSSVGAARGGLTKVAALQYAERVARGDETPPRGWRCWKSSPRWWPGSGSRGWRSTDDVGSCGYFSGLSAQL